MSSITKTISLTKEQDDFINEQNISPSGIFQDKINEIMQMSKVTGAQLREEVRKRDIFQKLCEQARIFIEKKGLLNDWLKEQGA